MTDDVKQAIATLMQREWNHGETGAPVTVLRLAFERLDAQAKRRCDVIEQVKEILSDAADRVDRLQ